jgi:hypothetical protein
VSVVNTSNFDENIAQIVTSTSAYYLLGYAPANTALDGTYRRITVRVSRPDVDVHARPGYLAAPPPEEAPIEVPEVSLVDEALGRLEAAVRAEGRVALEGGTALFRAGSAARAPFSATTDPRFRRIERLRLEVHVRDGGPVTAQLLDRRGEPLPVPVGVTERMDETAASRWAVLDLTLAPLAIGDYVLAVTQRDTTLFTAFRVVR